MVGTSSNPLEIYISLDTQVYKVFQYPAKHRRLFQHSISLILLYLKTKTEYNTTLNGQSAWPVL